ncbi:MAG: rRNA maturation RNase YbeY [Spirochaetes bacterium]|nr:rRNA maturation RNase YbeY [Spirochaetota bacterium]
MKNQNKINIFTENIKIPFKEIDKKYATACCMSVLRELDLNKKEINIILCSNEFIHSVNKDYRKKDRPTDVISFAYREDEFPNNSIDEIEQLGDIFLSLEKAYEQSIEYEVTLKEEFLRLVIHSILHLIGYDHETNEADAEIMRSREDKLMNSIEESLLRT